MLFVHAGLGKNTNAAGPILQRLYENYSVIVDEEKMVWFVETEDRHSYRLLGCAKDLSEKQSEMIKALIDRRYTELKKQNFQVVDTITEALWRKYGVIIDDELQQWRIV